MNKLALLFIQLYRRLSFLFSLRCKYTPSCSKYAECAFLRYPFWKAATLTFFRILRCNPFARGGFDPLR
ncbi:MAG: membrane protein insertion efficiency factor YidD [Candidatus Omnitrophota bacterium]|nr:MAG: membrane protein insertion efficiency factor YidD [Candidatus Omnitrophota bacterium]